MISNSEIIIDKVTKKKQIDKKMLSSMVNFVFEEAKEEFAGYNELSIYLPGLFIFFYGKTRLKKLKLELEKKIEAGKRMGITPKPTNFLTKMSLEELETTLQKVDYLLLRYEDYINEKREAKKARKESKTNPE